MNQNEFLEKVAEILEVEAETISLTTDYRIDIPEWDSLKGFSLIVMMDEDCGVVIDPQAFNHARTIGDLFALVANNKK
jgi:acyl carrier protein